MVSSLLFGTLLVVGVGFFYRSVKKLAKAIHLGRPLSAVDRKKERLLQMLRLGFGQQKMQRNLLVGVLHFVVYLGFLIINLELLEIVIDGLFGTHRVFSGLGVFYNSAIAVFEFFALAVILAVIVFWARRNWVRIARFWSPEMKGWPKSDANWILVIELILMLLFLTMNAADYALQIRGELDYPSAGWFPVSGLLLPLIDGFSTSTLMVIERTAWWLHIAGILFFLNYLYYSKHLHIILAFPHTYLSSLEPLCKLENNEVVTIGGFIGKTVDGVTTTYERGGSDRTAADIGILFHNKYETSIDFEKDSSVVSADPKIVDFGLREINELSYNEARIAGMFGMKILDPIAIKEIVEYGVSIQIRITNIKNPEKTTIIKRELGKQKNHPIKIVTGKENCAIIRIEASLVQKL